MNQHALTYNAAVDKRKPKTDRLIIERFLKTAAESPILIDSEIENAHKIIIKWADLAASGKLQQSHETSLQGEFITDIFGSALHYTTFHENLGEWEIEREVSVNGGTPDAIIGKFKSKQSKTPVAVVELKGPTVNLDRDRSGGRTAIQQCWEYLTHLPNCKWGIVSNMVSFRLYERTKTPRRYEHFALEDLRDINIFRRFFVLFHRNGLLVPEISRKHPRAWLLLEKTETRQREVGDKLYNYYRQNRLNLIRHLYDELHFDLEKSISTAQQLIDRIIFIAFCEDRELLPPKTLDRALLEVPAFTKVTNPRWRNFIDLFELIDKGGEAVKLQYGYNGGLFKKSPVDDLDLPDDPWVNFFAGIGEYDFRDEVNLDVLGHLFEKSITELEKLRQGDFFSAEVTDEKKYAEMPQSAKRKRLGIYYTPPQFTEYITKITVEDLITERLQKLAVKHGKSTDEAVKGDYPDTLDYWKTALNILRNIKICDPACGSGAFLFQAYSILEQHYTEIIDHLNRLNDPDSPDLEKQIPDLILNENIYGIDLSPEAVEITQLALWIKSAHRGKTLADLSRNIIHGNSLIRDTTIHPAAFKWEEKFPEVFNRKESGFDCIIGNPPWERMKLQEREFFSVSAPNIATATNAAKRKQLVKELETKNPDLYHRYHESLNDAQKNLDYVRDSGEYPLSANGDINTYAVFTELARKIVAPLGRVGLLVPSGIASDHTTRKIFRAIVDNEQLRVLYDFENRKGLFPDVHRSFKFSIFGFGGIDTQSKKADFVFFSHEMEELTDKKRHITLTRKDIKLLNPNTGTCPIFRSNRDAKITKKIYRSVPILIDKNRKTGGNPWGIRFFTMFHQTNDAGLFLEAVDLKKKHARLEGNQWIKGKKTYLPLYEAKMIQAYDHRGASVIIDKSNWFRQGQTENTSLVFHQNPEFAVIPRWWTEESNVLETMKTRYAAFMAFKNVTSPTNTRTMIASFIPWSGVINSAPLIFPDVNLAVSLHCCLLANLNSFVLDYIARNKIGNVNLNFFLIEQFATFAPDCYADPCPWDRDTTLEDWISERVLKLSCTAEDMLPLAEAADFTTGDLKQYQGRLNKWKVEERAQLKAELDAAFFILYQINRDDAEYILSTFKGIHQPAASLPGVRTTEERILETYDRLMGRL